MASPRKWRTTPRWSRSITCTTTSVRRIRASPTRTPALPRWRRLQRSCLVLRRDRTADQRPTLADLFSKLILRDDPCLVNSKMDVATTERVNAEVLNLGYQKLRSGLDFGGCRVGQQLHR